jgi:hypothetical protein
VLRPGGWLIFSSHNINYFQKLSQGFRFRASWNVWDTARSLKRFLQFSFRNRSVKVPRESGPTAVFDGHLVHFNIRPDQQRATLEELGWEEIRLFPYDSDRELVEIDDILASTSPWIYYWCRKR